MTQKTKTTAKSKKISLVEFKAWLLGVEELHDVDWCPSAEQWKLIRNKIKLIDTSNVLVSTPIANNQTTSNGYRPNGPGQQNQPQRQPQRAGFIPPAPLPQGGIPDLPVVPSNAAHAMMSGRLPMGGMPGHATSDAAPIPINKSFV